MDSCSLICINAWPAEAFRTDRSKACDRSTSPGRLSRNVTVTRDGEKIGLAHGTLYRGDLAARREGAVFDQRTLDVLSPGNRGVGRGGRFSGAVALGRQRRAGVGLSGAGGDGWACG